MSRRSPKKNSASASHELRLVPTCPLIGETAVAAEKEFSLQLKESKAPAVVLDLGGISHIDSRGVSVCIGLFRECAGAGRAFSIEADTPLAAFFRRLHLDAAITLREKNA